MPGFRRTRVSFSGASTVMRTLDQSIVLLKSSPFWNERREAALELGRCEQEQAREALVDALADRDEDVLQAVIVSLGRLGDRQVVEQMLLPRYLNHPTARIRWATLRSLEQIGGSIVAPEVANLTDDGEWVVRNEAQRVLQQQIEWTVKQGSLEAAQRMVSLLTSTNQELRTTLIDAFVKMGPRIKPLLRNFIKTGGKQIQTAIATVIGRMQSREFLPDLIALLKSPEASIRKSAVDALGRLGDPQAIPGIIQAFGDLSREVQLSAVEAMARIGKPAVEPLHETLRYSSRKSIQQNVLYALARIHDTSSIPHFVDSLSSTYSIVRRAAIKGLTALGLEAVEAVQEVIRTVELPMIDDLLNQAEKGATTVIRLRAIKALGTLADHRAVHLLKQLAASQEEAIQKAALNSMDEIGCACWQRCAALAVLLRLRIVPNVELIEEQLDDDSENVRRRAVQVLAQGGNPHAVPAVLQTVKTDANDTIRCAALRAADELAPADPKVVAAARKALDDPSPRVQAEGIRIIGRSPEAGNLRPLLESLKNPSWEVRRNAALALGNMGNIALPSLLDRIEKGDEIEVESVLRAIGNVGSLTTVPTLEEVLMKAPEGSPLRYAVRKALADIQEKQQKDAK